MSTCSISTLSRSHPLPHPPPSWKTKTSLSSPRSFFATRSNASTASRSKSSASWSNGMSPEEPFAPKISTLTAASVPAPRSSPVYVVILYSVGMSPAAAAPEAFAAAAAASFSIPASVITFSDSVFPSYETQSLQKKRHSRPVVFDLTMTLSQYHESPNMPLSWHDSVTLVIAPMSVARVTSNASTPPLEKLFSF